MFKRLSIRESIAGAMLNNTQGNRACCGHSLQIQSVLIVTAIHTHTYALSLGNFALIGIIDFNGRKEQCLKLKLPSAIRARSHASATACSLLLI